MQWKVGDVEGLEISMVTSYMSAFHYFFFLAAILDVVHS